MPRPAVGCWTRFLSRVDGVLDELAAADPGALLIGEVTDGEPGRISVEWNL